MNKFTPLSKLNKSLCKKSGMIFMLLLFLLLNTIPVKAVDTVPTEELKAEWEARKSLTVDTNLINEWPTGPLLGVESAVLIEADTGTILYSKNPDERLYPASITKMVTALLVVENCTMEEIVTFSNASIDNTEWGSTRIGIMKGEQLTVEQCLYGLLLGSANEVAYALAEHVGGDLETFVQMMNDKVSSLGCTNTHFINASGLPDPDHYVSAMDMAKIGKAFFDNDTLCLISGSYSYKIPPTNKTDEERPMENHHKMVIGKKYEYEGIIGGKTGFTKDARQTLVTCAQKEGMKLICVVMKDESPYQFLDTADLFDYGFTCFQKLKIKDYEKRYDISSANYFHTNIDIMGTSKSILELNDYGYVVIPKTLDFENVRVEVNYDVTEENSVAKLDYYVGDNKVGSTSVDYANSGRKTFEFANIIADSTIDEAYTYVPENKTIFVTISQLVKRLFMILGILFLITICVALFFAFLRSAQRAKMQKKKRYKQRSENKRYNYKKRSENKRHKQPIDEKSGKQKGLYIEPIYKDLSAKATMAAESDTPNELHGRELYSYEDYDEDEDDYNEVEAYTEEQLFEKYPEMEKYNTIPLHPLDDPNRWDE